MTTESHSTAEPDLNRLRQVRFIFRSPTPEALQGVCAIGGVML